MIDTFVANVSMVMNMMSNKISGVDQFLHENLTWERALDFYLQENSFLKTRLSQVLDNNSDKDFITLAEHFQSSFIQRDESMKELKQDIILLQRLLKDSIAGKEIDEKKLRLQQKKMQNEMGYFEKNFADLKNEFHQYLVSVI